MKNIDCFAIWMTHLSISAALAAIVVADAPAAELPGDQAAVEEELDRFREGLFQAFNEGGYKAMLENYCHQDVIATWQDGTSSKGYDEVLAEFAKLKTFIDTMKAHPVTDQRLILNDGQLIVASGDMDDVYDLKRGVTVKLHSRWQATLVRQNDRLLLIGFSASTNAFQNEVLDLYVKLARYRTGAIGGVAGLAAGIVLTMLVARRRRNRRGDQLPAT